MVQSHVFLISFLVCLLCYYFIVSHINLSKWSSCLTNEARDALNLTVLPIVTSAVYSIPRKSMLALAFVGSRDVLTDSIITTAVCSFSAFVCIQRNNRNVIGLSRPALLQMFEIIPWLLFLKFFTLIIQLNLLLVILHSDLA